MQNSRVAFSPIIVSVLGNWRDENEVFATSASLPGYECTGEQIFNQHLNLTFSLKLSKADPGMHEAFAPYVGAKVSAEEYQEIKAHSFVITIIGPADTSDEQSHGSRVQPAREVMKLAKAYIDSGGCGLYVWNSGNAHGAKSWQMMCAQPVAAVAAYGAYVRVSSDPMSKEFCSTGMHCMRTPDVLMRENLTPEEGHKRLFGFNMRQLDDEIDQNESRFEIVLDGQKYFAKRIDCLTQESDSDFWNPHGLWLLKPR